MRWAAQLSPATGRHDRYVEVPFELPPATSAFRVQMSCDRQHAVIDLGLLGPDGIRGWSGSARDGFTVTRRQATPGYLPGIDTNGPWAVLLGLHRVPDGGTHVTVEVEPGAGEPPPPSVPPPAPERPPPRDLPPRDDDRRWVAADLHSHTVHSDGALTVAELACLAAGRGLDVLAVTDHNTVSHHAELDDAGQHAGIRLLPGQEVTTELGHANCLGAAPLVDFRDLPGDWLATANAAGARLSLNHPVAGDLGWQYPPMPTTTLVEAWHGTWDRRSREALRWWQAHGGIPVGGSDYHRPGDVALPGQPTTWVAVTEPSGLVEGLGPRRVALSADVGGPVLLPEDDDGIVAVDAEGTVLIEPDGRTTRIPTSRWRGRHPGGPVLLRADDRIVALCP